jgi:hypothetical protein
MASSTEALLVAVTTAEKRCREGKDREWRGVSRKAAVGVYSANQVRRRRSETMPRKGPAPGSEALISTRWAPREKISRSEMMDAVSGRVSRGFFSERSENKKVWTK